MGKVVALDFGLKRTGIAVSDDAKCFAFGHSTVESKLLLTFLVPFITKEKIDTIVLGLPKRLNMENSHITENVHLLKLELEKNVTIPVVLYDERFTSKMAFDSLIQGGVSAKKRKDKGLIDEVSATILLQSYLRSLESGF